MADKVTETVETTGTQEVDNTNEIDDTQIGDTESQETNQDTDDTEQTEENQESEEFDPDNLDFGESESDYTFGDYNLSKFKDNINFADENIRNGFTALSAELKEQGFTQSQIEWLMQKEIDAVQNKKAVTEPTKEQVMKELSENLSIQERKDYRAVGSYLKENLKGTEIEKYYKEAMANPAVYKIVHALYTKNLSGKPLSTGSTKDTKETKKVGKTFEQVTEEYLDFMAKTSLSREDKKPYIEKILSNLSKSQREEFKKIFSIE